MQCREAVEWGFARITGLWSFLDFLKKNLKIYKQRMDKATTLTDCHSCLNDSQTGDYFNFVAPNLHAYLHTAEKKMQDHKCCKKYNKNSLFIC